MYLKNMQIQQVPNSSNKRKEVTDGGCWRSFFCSQSSLFSTIVGHDITWYQVAFQDHREY